MVAIPSAREALTKYAVMLRPDQDVFEAIEALVKRQVTGAPVVDADGSLVGVLTAKDCLRILSNATWDEIPGGHVRDFMSSAGTAIEAESSLLEVAALFLDSNFPVLPVLDRGRVIGKIRRPELLARLHALAAKLERERDRRRKRMARSGDDPDAQRRLELATSLEELCRALG